MDKNPASSAGTPVCKFLYDADICTSTFQIPCALVKSYGNHDVLPSQATLKIDHDSGKSWSVKIEKFRDLYFFTDGWKEFAQDADLKTREYLLIRSPGLSEFRVETVESNSHNESNSGHDQTENSEDEDCSSDQEYGSSGSCLSFTVELKRYHIHRLVFPKRFTNGSRVKEDRSIILQDVGGRKWPVTVTDRSFGTFAMTAGWSNFLIANNVVVGSTMSFKFVSSSSNVIKARVVKEGRNKQLLFNLVRRKGGRFEVSGSRRVRGIAKMPASSHKENKHVDGPECSRKRSDNAEDPESSRETSKHLEGLRNSHLKVKAGNGDQITEDENGFRETLIFSEELMKQHAQKSPESSTKTSEHANELETSYATSDHSKGSKTDLNSGDQNVNGEDEDSFTDHEIGSSEGRSLAFSAELKSHHVNRLDLPRNFTDGSRAKENRIIILQDVKGRKWPVRLTDRYCGRFAMTAGWRDFLVANRVAVGSIMSFKFISCSSNIVEARVVKEGTNKKLLFNLVRRVRGRHGVLKPHGALVLPKGRHNEKEYAEGPDNFSKTGDHAEEPESSHKAHENAEGLGSSWLKVKCEDEDHIAEGKHGFGGRSICTKEFKKRHAPDMPESSHNTSKKLPEEPETCKISEHAEVANSSHERRGYAKGLENIHLKIKSENEDFFGGGWILSEELKKQNAIERPENFDMISKHAKEPEISSKPSEHVEVSSSSRMRSEYAKGYGNIYIKSENENQLAQEENDFGGKWICSGELKKQNAPEKPKCSCETSKHAEVPQTSCKTSENVDVTDSSHKRRKYANGLENIHLDVKSEHGGQCPQEENGFEVGTRWTFSNEL